MEFLIEICFIEGWIVAIVNAGGERKLFFHDFFLGVLELNQEG